MLADGQNDVKVYKLLAESQSRQEDGTRITAIKETRMGITNTVQASFKHKHCKQK